MKNRLITFICVALMLPLVGCNKSETNIDNPVLTMPTEITQMETEYADFDPATVLETLESAPIWSADEIVSLTIQDGKTIISEIYDSDNSFPSPGLGSSDYVFLDNNVRIYFKSDAFPVGPMYEDVDMQYDLVNRTITMGKTDMYGNKIDSKDVSTVAAMSNDAILLERHYDAYTDMDGRNIPESTELELLRAGTQANLDSWKQDARPAAEAIAEYLNSLNN